MDLKALIRDVPDFPKPGILFKDITPLLRDAKALAKANDQLAARLAGRHVDAVAGIESRGFIFSAMLAIKLGVGLIPLRKPRKLPYKTLSESYHLEYGTDALEMHTDAVKPGDKVAVVDDLLATGGTMDAARRLVARGGAEVVACLCVVELAFLKGREALHGTPVESLIVY